MSSVLTVLAVAVGGILLLFIGLNFFVRFRAKALEGKPLPAVPGNLGKRLSRTKHALVYFFSPQCAACRTLTPQLQKLQKQNANVFLVDVSTQFEVARALKVMATPSTIEVDGGRIVGVHVGVLPPEVMTRFAR